MKQKSKRVRDITFSLIIYRGDLGIVHMREIKFNYILQNKETGRFISKTYSYTNLFLGSVQLALKELEMMGYYCVAKREFTGIKDKNGKEIYEGDILKIIASKFVPDEDGLDHEEIIVKIHFKNGCFWFTGANRTDCNWHFYNESDREVVGNIYENPELLSDGVA